MQRFKNILVFANQLDDLDELLSGARELAKCNEASLTVCDVVPAALARTRIGRMTSDDLDIEGQMVAARREALAKQLRHGERVRVEVGTPFIQVIQMIHAEGYDLVIMAPEPAPIRLGLIGATTTLHLLRKSPVPVMVNQPGHDERDVAVAIGPLDDEGRATELDTTLMELGSSLAGRRGGVLHVIHAWRLYGESFLNGARAGLSKEEVAGFAAALEAEAELGIKELVEQSLVADVPYRVHLRKGDAAEVISRVVDEVQPGMLVMGTLARSGVRGLLIGNTAERVLGPVSTSVLAVKPPGFESPVLAW